MKFLRTTVLVAVAVASAAVAHADAGVPGARVAYEAGLLLESDESAELPASYFLRRGLQAGSGPGTTAPPPTTTAPPPTTTAPPPTTTAPPPTTTAPPPTTPPPTTTAPPTTPPPTTPGPTTKTPETTTPAPTDKKDGSGNNSTTPPPTTAGPTTTKPPSDAGSVTSGGSEASEAGPNATPSPKKLADSSSSGGDAKTESKSNKMSTGTIIGIVGGIVVGVGILAVIAVVLARKRREEDDDPLSPFELSMDKGYNGAAAGGYGGQPQQTNPNQYGNQNQYGNGARPNNAAAIGGAAAVGAAAGVGAGVMMTTDTPSAGADAAGVAYTQFYDPVTSPSSMYHQEQTHASDLASARTDPAANGSNLWMSAMEPKENDVEGAPTGASVPPEISLPEDLANNSSFVSRNSYDELPGTSVDIDQSSVLSGGSDLEKDFPDYEDGSSRGSYEL